jgi:hypothetical protein
MSVVDSFVLGCGIFLGIVVGYLIRIVEVGPDKSLNVDIELIKRARDYIDPRIAGIGNIENAEHVMRVRKLRNDLIMDLTKKLGD